MVTTSCKATAKNKSGWTRYSVFVLMKRAMGADKVRHSSCQVGGWVQWKGGWLCQPIPLLTAYLWCALTRCKGPINSDNMPSVEVLSNGSEIKIQAWWFCWTWVYIICLQWYSVQICVFHQITVIFFPLTLIWMVTNEMPKNNLSGTRNYPPPTLLW